MQLNESVFEKFPMLETRRLLLRDIRMEDSGEIYGMRSSGRVNQFIARPGMPTEEDAQQLIARTRAAYENKMAIGWAGVLKEKKFMIGTCGFNQIDWPNLRAEIGGEMAVEQWGKGIAIEAVSAIVGFGLYHFGLHSIEAKVSPGNRGAIYLLESLGFAKEAHFRERIFFQGSFGDMAVYTLIKGEEARELMASYQGV